MPKYKNAFKCSDCPESNGEKGCPAWWEYVETNIQTGDERLTKVCGIQALPNLLVQVLKAANRPSAEIGAMRGEIVQGFTKVAEVVQELPLLKKE